MAWNEALEEALRVWGGRCRGEGSGKCRIEGEGAFDEQADRRAVRTALLYIGGHKKRDPTLQ